MDHIHPLLRRITEKLVPEFRALIPDRKSLVNSRNNLFFILFGGLLLSPLVSRLPMPGWDWFYFYNKHNINFNISTTNAYPPFAQYLIIPLTSLNWHFSLGVLNSFALISIALLTYQGQKKYWNVILAITCLPVFFLLWIGHIDGLTLIGIATGFIPLILVKPQIAVWSVFRNRRWFYWTVFTLVISLLFWPLWPLKMANASFNHPANFGWSVLGWPIAFLGILFLLGAGNDPFRLMAAGCLVSPFLMPYSIAILVPILGRAKGYRAILIWITTWLMFLGVGLGGGYRYFNLVFPISAYWLTLSPKDYWNNVLNLWLKFRSVLSNFRWMFPNMKIS